MLLFSDEGPETGDESDEDIVRSYLPGAGDVGGGYIGDTNHNIPAINITLHSPGTNHVLGESPLPQRPLSLKFCSFLGWGTFINALKKMLEMLQ